jgi:hypothetical protein
LNFYIGFLFQNIDKKLSIGEKQTIDPLPSYGCLFGLRGYVRALTQRDTSRFKKRRLAAAFQKSPKVADK